FGQETLRRLPVTHVVQQVERANALPQRRAVVGDGLPARYYEGGIPEKVRGANLIGITEGVFRARVGLVHDTVLAANHRENVTWRRNVVHGSVFRVRPLERSFRLPAHKP